MGWLSRTFGSGENGATPPTPPAVPTAPLPPPSSTPSPSTPPSGRYGPLVSVTHFDTAPPELEWQLPLNGELYRLMPGSDRPDYSLFVLERPVHFYPAPGFDLGRVEPEQRVEDRKGRPMVRVHALLLCARFVGQQLHPGMKDLAVNLAYVIDNSLARDAEVDFGKIEFAAIGFLSEGRAPRPGTATDDNTHEPTTPEPTVPEPTVPEPTVPEPERAPEPTTAETGTQHAPAEPAITSPAASAGGGDDPVGAVLDEVAVVLRRGIEAQRGAPVSRLTAALTVGPDLRLTGLSGNADGQAPVPTPETFAQLAEVLARLGRHPGGSGRVAAFTVRVDGDRVSHEVTATH